MTNANFYSAAGSRPPNGGSKQALFLGVGIFAVVIVTYMTYQYFTKGTGHDAPIVITEEAPGVTQVGEEVKDVLPSEAQDVRDAVSIYTAIADKSLDTAFFSDVNFTSLVERTINVPKVSPRPGRVFELWTAPSAESRPKSSTRN